MSSIDEHDPLTCRQCSPEPWAQAELTRKGRTRRYTGWAAAVITAAPILLGPLLLVALVVGLAAGLLLGVAVAR